MYDIQKGVFVYDSFGKEVVNAVNDRFKGTLAEISSDCIEGRNKPVSGSNIFRLFAIDRASKNLDARVMLPEESEFMLAQRKLPSAGETYFDLGVVLDFSRQNHNLATHLYDQIPDKDLDRLPAVMLGLDLDRTNIGEYGLAFTYLEGSEMRTAKILSRETGYFEKDDSELVKSGLPSKLGSSERKLFTSTQYEPSVENLGLSGLDLDRCLSLYSN